MDSLTEIYNQIEEDYIPEVKAREVSNANNHLDDYIERLKERIRGARIIKARNYFEEQTLPYLRYLVWPTDEKFFEDMKLFWMSANIYYRKHTNAEYIRLLEWAKSKKNLHVRQLVKVFKK